MKTPISDDFSVNLDIYKKEEPDNNSTSTLNTSTNSNEDIPSKIESDKLLDPFCHYNTSLNSKYLMIQEYLFYFFCFVTII